MPNDGGFLLLDQEERDALVRDEPTADIWIRPLLGSVEFINSIRRYCLWLVDATPAQLRALPVVSQLVANVREKRLKSDRATTRELADTPALFGERRQPTGRFVVIPEVSSEARPFIPIGFLEPNTIVTNKLYTIDGATLFDFGLVTSTMHMAWNRAVGGRLKSDYQYSAGLVYNNFPWPTPTAAHRAVIETAAQNVLDARAEFPDSSLADLYDSISMPARLSRAHQILDRAVDTAYGRPRGSNNEAERVAFLFQLYQQLIAPVEAVTDAPRTRIRRRKSTSARLP